MVGENAARYYGCNRVQAKLLAAHHSKFANGEQPVLFEIETYTIFIASGSHFTAALRSMLRLLSNAAPAAR